MVNLALKTTKEDSANIDGEERMREEGITKHWVEKQSKEEKKQVIQGRYCKMELIPNNKDRAATLINIYRD